MEKGQSLFTQTSWHSLSSWILNNVCQNNFSNTLVRDKWIQIWCAWCVTLAVRCSNLKRIVSTWACLSLDGKAVFNFFDQDFHRPSLLVESENLRATQFFQVSHNKLMVRQQVSGRPSRSNKHTIRTWPTFWTLIAQDMPTWIKRSNRLWS